ncbi:hypothetical protein K1T71_014014 [Dendrolimus kikuchii]|uniref:Uncharacterized protein n=1 Tax=Dendrolimus kikuchii TaxID=765133 RepID=A0ACC1CGD8_9NEOP|nr:hypothetical protein K1T71_014014 [Dendrolimus kikuchii]
MKQLIFVVLILAVVTGSFGQPVTELKSHDETPSNDVMNRVKRLVYESESRKCPAGYDELQTWIGLYKCVKRHSFDNYY